MRTPFRQSQLPTSYTAAKERLGKRESVRVCNATTLERRHNAIAVRLWNTDVVTFEPSGRIRLDTGGWNTVTTRSRMMACLRNWCVWGARPKAYNLLHRIDGEDYHFNRRITINADGSVSRFPGDRDVSTDHAPPRRRRYPRIGRLTHTSCSDIPGSADNIVPPEIVAEDENRWAEYNRKFNELFRPKPR
jgi:hypothetical protein